MPTRAEHMKWVKQRAIMELEYYSDVTKAVTNSIISVMSDLRKHPETNSETLVSLCMMELASGRIRTKADARKFIDGFSE